MASPRSLFSLLLLNFLDRNLHSSQKILDLCYADYQGKEALVEKFKNSGIMEEKPEWRPRIFYSSGPMQGQPEPFPEATHQRRKERGRRDVDEESPAPVVSVANIKKSRDGWNNHAQLQILRPAGRRKASRRTKSEAFPQMAADQEKSVIPSGMVVGVY